jgi:hypothetical protein
MEPRGGILRAVQAAGHTARSDMSEHSPNKPNKPNKSQPSSTLRGVGAVLGAVGAVGAVGALGTLAYKYTRSPVHPRRAQVLSVVVEKSNEFKEARLKAKRPSTHLAANEDHGALFVWLAVLACSPTEHEKVLAKKELSKLGESFLFAWKFRDGTGDFDVSISPVRINGINRINPATGNQMALLIDRWFEMLVRDARAYADTHSWLADVSDASRWHIKVCLERPESSDLNLYRKAFETAARVVSYRSDEWATSGLRPLYKVPAAFLRGGTAVGLCADAANESVGVMILVLGTNVVGGRRKKDGPRVEGLHFHRDPAFLHETHEWAVVSAWVRGERSTNTKCEDILLPIIEERRLQENAADVCVVRKASLDTSTTTNIGSMKATLVFVTISDAGDAEAVRHAVRAGLDSMILEGVRVAIVALDSNIPTDQLRAMVSVALDEAPKEPNEPKEPKKPASRRSSFGGDEIQPRPFRPEIARKFCFSRVVFAEYPSIKIKPDMLYRQSEKN